MFVDLQGLIDITAYKIVIDKYCSGGSDKILKEIYEMLLKHNPTGGGRPNEEIITDFKCRYRFLLLGSLSK